MPATWNPNTREGTVTCDRCGKPLVEVDEDGMFCEDGCFREESKAARKTVLDLIAMFTKESK